MPQVSQEVEERTLKASCPFCQSSIGTPCHNDNGQRMDGVHFTRLSSARMAEHITDDEYFAARKGEA